MSRCANISLIAEREMYLILFAGKCSKYYAAYHPHDRLEDSTNLQAPCVLYIGQAFRYSPENAFYIFNQQIFFIILYLLDRASLI